MSQSQRVAIERLGLVDGVDGDRDLLDAGERDCLGRGHGSSGRSLALLTIPSVCSTCKRESGQLERLVARSGQHADRSNALSSLLRYSMGPLAPKSRLGESVWGSRRLLRPGLQLLLDHLGQVAERPTVLITELARLLVHDAQRADVVASRTPDRLAGVKPDARLLQYKRVLGEPRIEHRVFNDEYFGAIDRVAAEGQVARAVADGEPLRRFEPLALALDEGDAGEGRAKHLLRHATDLVEPLFGRGIDRRAEPELHQSLRLVLRNERTHHFLRLRPQSTASHHRGHPRAESAGIYRL